MCPVPLKPSCSKLNEVISFLKYGKYIDIFCRKNVSSFCIINVFENVLATTANESVINELVKLAML